MRKQSVGRTIIVMITCCSMVLLSSCFQGGGMSSSQLPKDRTLLQSQIKTIDDKIAVIDAEIAKHRANMQRMRATLNEAIKNHTQPDVSKLHQIATATGQRTAAYHAKPPWMQDMIDKFESKNPAGAAATLAMLTAVSGIGRAHYIMEISRTNQFINMLENERNNLLNTRAQLAEALAAANQSSGDQPSVNDSQVGGY